MLNFGEFAVYDEKITVRKTLHIFCMMIFENVVNTEVLIYKTDVSRNPYSVRKTWHMMLYIYKKLC